MTSCSPVLDFYQVYKAEPENLQKQKDALLFEDVNCKVLYNLWAENGNIGFVFLNKTEKTIFINKEECFFILNGIANDYFQERTYTKSSGVGFSSNKGVSSSTSSGSEASGTIHYAKSETNLYNAAATGIITTETKGGSSTYSENISTLESEYLSQTTIVSKGFSVSYKEPTVIRIPPKSAKLISEFQIVSKRYKNCDLKSFPQNGMKSLTFTKENSPMTFSNRICYSFETSFANPIFVENKFFISEISNVPYDEFFEKKYEYSCGKESEFKVLFRRYASPEKFYYVY